MLELAQPGHLQFGQKPKPSKTKLKPKISWNHGFGHFLAYSDMLGIKKHVLKVGTLLLASDMSFELIQNQTESNQIEKDGQN